MGINIIEYLAENVAWMDKFCKDCKAFKNCLCEHSPFYDDGCVRKVDIKDIEDAAENFEKMVEGMVA